MSTPVAIRFDDDLLAEVRSVAKSRSMSVSAVIQMFTDEGIKALKVPGIIFRDGAVGRRPAVAGCMDVWKLMSTVKINEDDQTLQEIADYYELPVHFFETAVEYHRLYTKEIDDWIAEHYRSNNEAYEAWLSQQEASA
ncbi:MAG: hypothetical protein LBE83_01145 [Propionibacteriaceae bacterium]|jgi:hypothetical protein|nr:hypothetical protein [Propionibacteriaceae bacterium]